MLPTCAFAGYKACQTTGADAPSALCNSVFDFSVSHSILASVCSLQSHTFCINLFVPALERDCTRLTLCSQTFYTPIWIYCTQQPLSSAFLVLADISAIRSSSSPRRQSHMQQSLRSSVSAAHDDSLQVHNSWSHIA